MLFGAAKSESIHILQLYVYGTTFQTVSNMHSIVLGDIFVSAHSDVGQPTRWWWWWVGGRLNKIISSYEYTDPHDKDKDKTVSRQPLVNNNHLVTVRFNRLVMAERISRWTLQWVMSGASAGGHVLISLPYKIRSIPEDSPIWGRQGPDGPHVGPMKIAIWGRSVPGASSPAENCRCHE